MEMNEYQRLAMRTAHYQPGNNRQTIVYPVLGLLGEFGELASILKREMRDDTPIDRHAVLLELGDKLWYLTCIARDFDMTLEEIAEANIEKLADRAARGVIKGSGDYR